MTVMTEERLRETENHPLHVDHFIFLNSYTGRKNESLAISSISRDVLLARIFSLRPGVPTGLLRRVSTTNANTADPFDLRSRFHVPVKAPSKGHAQMHVRSMHVLGFPKSSGDPHDGQTFDLPPKLH